MCIRDRTRGLDPVASRRDNHFPFPNNTSDDSTDRIVASITGAFGFRDCKLHKPFLRFVSGRNHFSPSPEFYTTFFFAAFSFAHRTLCAAAILFLPAAEIVRVRFTGADAVAAAGFDSFRACAHRFFCARLIRLRADADNVRCLFELELPKAASAALNRLTSCFALLSSFFKCPTTPDNFPIVPPRLEIVPDRVIPD